MSELRLFTESLFSKWGFNDGDMPEEVWKALNYTRDCEWRPVLQRIVRERMLPLFDEKIECYNIDTAHNPIRADSIDGVDVPDDLIYDPVGRVPELSLEYVDIPMDDVVAFCKGEL